MRYKQKENIEMAWKQTAQDCDCSYSISFELPMCDIPIDMLKSQLEKAELDENYELCNTLLTEINRRKCL